MSTDPDVPRREAVHGIVPEGDSSCWLGELCPECGAMPEAAQREDPSTPCWRCGVVPAGTVGEETAPEE